MAHIFIVHSTYDQPYCYEGEGHTTHSIKLFSTLVGAQAYVTVLRAQKGKSGGEIEIEDVIVDDPNSGCGWCSPNGY
jgi:hypothetical protein